MSLATLAAFAATSQLTRSTTPVYELPIEEARGKVVVKDGFRNKPEDGSQALTLTLGKITLKLDAVKPNATRIIATKDQVEEFTAILEAGVKAGDFDAAIVEGQAGAKAAAEKRAATVAAQGEATSDADGGVEAAPEGVDLDALDA